MAQESPAEGLRIRLALEELGSLLTEASQHISRNKSREEIARSGHPSNVNQPRFVYENYGLFILDSFQHLFQRALAAENEVFVGATFRILYEVGMKKVHVFLSGAIDPTKEQGARLISTLVDYALINEPVHAKHFCDLFEEEKYSLNVSHKCFSEAYKHFSSSSSELPISILKKLKRCREGVIGEYWNETPMARLPHQPDFEMLSSIWSEVLHGNPFASKSFLDKDIERMKYHLYAILWFSGQNVIRTIQPRITDSELVNRANIMIGRMEKEWIDFREIWKADLDEETLLRINL